ncbi:MAG: NAD-dependent epimerase/dehydratase family protein [Chloroflexota bacterium]
MRVLVTGTDGYIGAMLAPLLVNRGHEVVGVDTGFYREGWFNDCPPTSYTRIDKDVRRVSEDDVRGFDAVVHLAELSNDPLGEHDPAVTFQINHQGSAGFAARCKAAGISRFVYSSSCSVYGAGADGFRTEESETDPQTVYAQCKILVEQALMALADDDFSPTCLRNATAFGPSPRMRFDIVLNNLAGLAWTTKEIKMTSDGTPWRPLVHVLDICDAIACTLEAPRQAVHAQIFNVGDTRQNYRVKEIAAIVADVFPGCALSFGQSDGDKRSYRVSFDKIHRCLPEFDCVRDAAVGARQLFDLFSRVDMTAEDFAFRAYTRLKQLTYLLESRQLDTTLFWQR